MNFVDDVFLKVVKMLRDQEIMVCGHCRKEAVLIVRAQNESQPTFDDTYSGQEITVFRVLVCSLCNEPTLEQSRIEYSFERDGDGTGLTIPIAAEKKILYPGAKTTKALPDIPTMIAKEYEATLRVRDVSSNACAVLARRTLEAIFIHQGATGGSLYQKIDTLLKSTSIPPLLADVAHIGRHIGNLGAHFEKGEATDEDVAVMLDFLETILEYLYVIPAKVAVVKARLTQAAS